jgi:thiamine biosynthesis lipoprotein
MNSSSQDISSGIERAKPFLGTTVSVRVHGLAPAVAHAAIGAAFAAVCGVHEAMSFHESDSEVSRLNRDAHRTPVAVSDATYAVIAHALTMSALTDGIFDITVAPLLVARRHLPRPAHAPAPDGAANWRDIQLLPGNRVRFCRPLWVDLGGIAKGYAVDRAMAIVRSFAPAQAAVNAGGDLRLAGPKAEGVRLACEEACEDFVPVIELKQGSLASSAGTPHGPHIDPHRRRRERSQFVSVTAPRCVDADALTKVVMASGASSARTLAAFGARAIVHDAEGWHEIGEQA